MAAWVRHLSRTLRRAEFYTATTAFLPTFFITFFSYAHHSLAPQSVRRYLDSAPSRTAPVSRDERISGRKLFTAIYNIWPRSAPPQVHAKQQNSMLSPIF